MTEMKKAAETALKLELDSIDFYTKAAEKVGNELGRSIFQSLIKDEERHVVAVRKLLEEAAPGVAVDEILPARGKTFKSDISTVFSEARKHIDERIAADADDLQALSTAMELERDGYRFYGEAAGNAEDETVEAVYRRLQGEESEHFEFLQNTYQYLENSGDWLLWEEQGLLDGG